MNEATRCASWVRALPPGPRAGGVLRFSLGVATAIALGLSLTAPAPLGAQERAQTGSIEGRVFGALSQSYLVNARVSIPGTSLLAMTDERGYFRLPSVPAGSAELEIFYTGYQTKTEPVAVEAGERETINITLSSPSGYANVDGEEVFELEAFNVSAAREYNADSIAINEQRFASTIKNVVSTDAFGEINQGNIGEFLKHVPGVTIEVKDGNSPSGIQIRGFNSNYTNVTVDGGTIASAAQANTNNHTRIFQLETANINNLDRIEVTKLPTPDMPSNSLGGSVNLVSKSAFDRQAPEFRYAAYLTGNGEAFTFGKRPGTGEGKDRVILPSFDMSYVMPVNDKLGFVFTYAHSNQYSTQDQAVLSRNWGGEDGDDKTTPDDPYTSRLNYSTGGNRSERNSGSFKVDYKPWEGNVFSLTAQANAFKNEASNRTITFDARNLASWDESNAYGAEGQGRVSLGGSSQVRHGLTQALAGKYDFRRGNWKADLGINYSVSKNQTRDFEKGVFRGVSTQMYDPTKDTYDRDLRVNLLGIDNDDGSVDQVEVYAEDGSLIDYTDLSNYVLKSGTGDRFKAKDTVWDVRANARYDFEERPFSVKFGLARNHLKRDIVKTSYTWDYLGQDGIKENLDNQLDPYYDSDYQGLGSGFVGGDQEWFSPWLAYDSLEDSPELWEYSDRAAGDTAKNLAVRSPVVEETITSGYFMGDGRFLDNKLRLVGGVRYELTENSGWGYKQDPDAVYQRDANGEFIYDDDGNRVLLDGLTSSNTPEYQSLVYQYRAQYNERDYDGFYPSLTATYNLTQDMLLRFGYARTIGRPATVDIVPYLYVQANIWNPNDAGAYPGWVVAGNSTLEPWQANNYDLSLEYYLPQNGLVSIGVFRKDISDFFGDIEQVVDEELAAELDLPDEAIGYWYETRINAGDAEIRGIELSWNQPLDMLGAWAEGSSVFANYTRLKLSGSNEADFTDFIPRTANLGYRFSRGKWSGTVKWNYRGRQFRESYEDLYPDGGEYIRSRNQFDANIDYQLSERLSIFAAGRNITNNPNEWEVRGSMAPAWSSLTSYTTYGAQYSLGVKGSF